MSELYTGKQLSNSYSLQQLIFTTYHRMTKMQLAAAIDTKAVSSKASDEAGGPKAPKNTNQRVGFAFNFAEFKAPDKAAEKRPEKVAEKAPEQPALPIRDGENGDDKDTKLDNVVEDTKVT